MVIGATLIAMVAGFEGYRQEAYIPIPGDVPTVGHGFTEIDGKPVELGQTIDEEASRALLEDKLDKVYAEGVRNCLNDVPVHTYEFEAFSSLTFNIGVHNFCTSTLVKKIQEKDYKGACEEINKWVYAQGKVVQGLVNRREKEYRHCIGQGNETMESLLEEAAKPI